MPRRLSAVDANTGARSPSGEAGASAGHTTQSVSSTAVQDTVSNHVAALLQPRVGQAERGQPPSKRVRLEHEVANEETPIKKMPRVEYSENSKYAVRPSKNGSKDVFVKANDDVAIPAAMKRSQSGSVYDGNYHRYEPAYKVRRDCLDSTEETNSNRHFNPDPKGDGHVRSELALNLRGKKLAIGDSDEGNMKAAKAALKSKPREVNHDAEPVVGQGLISVKVDSEKLLQGSPYHAAPVVAVDGKSYVTLEVSATARHAVERVADQKAYMYTKGDTERSFHAANEAGGYKGSITIPIQPNGNEKDSTPRT